MVKQFLFMMSVYFCVFFQIHGMELALKKHKQHKNIVYTGEHDIPFFPLVRNKSLPSIRNILVKHRNIPEDVLCNVALLPKELRELIALKIFDNNYVAAKVFLKTPFFYAINFYHQDRELLKEGLFIKEVSLDRLFCWPINKKNKMIAITASQHPASWFYEDCVFTSEQIEQIRLLDSQELNDFFIGGEVMVINPETTWKKYSYAIPCCCAGIGFVSTAIVATTACLAGSCSSFIFITGGIAVGSSCLLGTVGAGLIYAHVVKKNIHREVI